MADDETTPRPEVVRRHEGPEIHHILGARKEDPIFTALKGMQSQQIDDPFANVRAVTTGQGDVVAKIIDPVYNPAALARMPRENNSLRQCVDAMVTNVVGHGWHLEPLGEEKDASGADAEKDRLTEFLTNPNDKDSLPELLGRLDRDLEDTGDAYMEVMRSGSEEIIAIDQIPAHTMRVTTKDPTPVKVDAFILRNGKLVKLPRNKRFRRFVQVTQSVKVFFKEFGDPRTLDPATGLEANLSPEDSATEIIRISLYAPGLSYGLPRWFPQLPSVQGSRQAELTNLDFFQDNGIPALAVLVSGGSLTSNSLRDIEQHLSAARGRSSMNRIAVLEAKGDDNASSEAGTIPAPRIEMKSLAGDRQKDGLFLDYDERCAQRVRSAFRLPPIFLGESADYSHATAKVSYEVAESQVFNPERERIEGVFNRQLLPAMSITMWEFKLNSAQLTDQSELVEALGVLDKVGALSPNSAIIKANEMFGLDIQPIEEAWGDLPWQAVMAVLVNGEEEEVIPGLEGAVEGLENQITGLTDDDGDE